MRSPTGCGNHRGFPAAGWPCELAVRRAVVTGLTGDTQDAEVLADARAVLPGLITVDFQTKDPEAFRALYREMVEHCDRESATDAMVAFLASANDLSHAGREVSLMVRQLNSWNGIDIASLGLDVGNPIAYPDSYNWRQVALDALEWRHTGTCPAEIPPGYRVGPNDLRVILTKEGEPDKARISLCRDPGAPDVMGRVYTVTAEGAALAYVIMPAHWGPSFGWSPTGPPRAPSFKLHSYIRTPSRQNPPPLDMNIDASGRTGALPRYRADHAGWTVTVEKADCPSSVLGGTEVFTEWWKKYGVPDVEPDGEPAKAVPGEDAMYL